MNVFIFCGPLAFGKGGMEKVAANLANYLSKNNIVTLGYFVRSVDDRPAYFIDKAVFLAPWFKSLNNSRSNYSKRIVESSPDIFIYFGASSQALDVVSLLEGYNVPILMHEGSNPTRVIKDSWACIREISVNHAAWEREALYSQASLIRLTMPEYLESLPISIRKFAIAFPNAFELPEVCSEVKENKRIINIGGLKPNKNIMPLLNVCGEVFKKHPDWQLHVFSAVNNSSVGKEYAQKVLRLILDRGLSNNVFLNSEVDDLNNEYLASGIHITTSLSEGLSNAVAESMTYGIPTIGISKVPGVDGLVRHNRNGFLIRRENIETNLFEALDKLISNEGLRQEFGCAAREDAHIFNPSLIYRKWDEAIKLCLENYGKQNSEIHRHYSRTLIDLYKEVIPEFQKEKECRELKKHLLSVKSHSVDESLLIEKERILTDSRWSYV